MKNLFALYLCTALAWLSLGASRATAAFVSPNVPTHESAARSALGPVPAPGGLTVSNTHDAGPGSLRSAISNAPPGATIRFALHYPAVIELQSTLVIDKDLMILGPGPQKLIVTRTFAQRAPSFRVFSVNAGVVTLTGMTIFNGRALNPDGFSDNLGGGILNFGTLTVSNCVVTHNEAPMEAGGRGFGGGIFSVGSLTLLNSTFSQNNASGAGGGVCTFHTPNFVVDGCTLSDNFAGVQGGGVNFQGLSGHIKNSTISGNETKDHGDASGLLHIVFESESSDLSFSACTITRNHGGTNAVVIAALPANRGIITRMIDTLVADNQPGNFGLIGAVVQSLGHNLDSDGTSGFINGVNGDIVGTPGNPIDAKLGPLLPNGGPTFTHALLPGSPALDAGACMDADGPPLTIDQRGFPRPQGLACDIGAFENQPPTLICPEPGTVECSEDLRVTVNDPDGDPLTLVWTVDGTDVQTNFLSAVHPPKPRKVKLKVSLATGPHTISVRVSDGKASVVQCSSIVTVQDTKPPRISKIKAGPRALWPADNRLVPVKLTVRVDDCGPTHCRIVSVRSNQAVGNQPDGIITGDLTLQLRATRTGNADRVYTITAECTDTAGNASQGTVTVTVPRNRPPEDGSDDQKTDENEDHGPGTDDDGDGSHG